MIEITIIALHCIPESNIDRLEYLSLIAIENKAASKSQLNGVVDRLANIKARKKLQILLDTY